MAKRSGRGVTEQEEDYNVIDNTSRLILKNIPDFVEKHFVSENGKPLKLTQYQIDFIKPILHRTHDKFVWVSSRRVGKSEACACLATLMAIVYNAEQVVIIAPTFRQAERLFKRIKNYFMTNKNLRLFADVTRGFRRDEIWLKNGSVIRCLSASGVESLLGAGATTLIIDEASAIPDEIIKTRILPMLASSGAFKRRPILVLVGTPHLINFMFEAWNSDDFKKFKVTWKDAIKEGILDEQEMMFQKKTMSEKEFAVWFDGEFVGTSDSLFPQIDVNKLMVLEKLSSREDDGDRYDYYAGLDVARLGTDESCFAVIRVPKGVQFEDTIVEFVYYSTREQIPTSHLLEWVGNKIEEWRPKYVVVDEIGVGGAICDLLQRKYGDMINPLTMVGKLRSDVYLTLSELIKTAKILLPKDEKLKSQFMSFDVAYQSDGRIRIIKNPKMKDDIVDALAFATYMAKIDKGEVLYFLPDVRL